MDGLAAVEDDVERKRVGKNPFDEKFTSLVRILRAQQEELGLLPTILIVDSLRPDSKCRTPTVACPMYMWYID